MKARIFFVHGYFDRKNYIDVEIPSYEDLNKKMDVLPEELISFPAPSGRYYVWTRKHIKDWKIVD